MLHFKFFILFFITVLSLSAHQSRENYINIEIDKKQVVLTCDIETDNFAKVLSIDDDANSIVSWRELRANEEMIVKLFLKNVFLVDGSKHLLLSHSSPEIHRRDDQSYMRVVLRAPREPKVPLILHYQLFFDLDPLQRVFVVIEDEGERRSMLLTPSQRQLSIYGEKITWWQQFRTFFQEGVEHIWSGYDHLLFLLMLILPLFTSKSEQSKGRDLSLKKVLYDVLKIVTLFSLAHSLTLGAAFFDIARVNVKLIESLITLSIIVTALFNVFSYVPKRIYPLVFVFGLLHGFGFANALNTLALGNTYMALSLLGFNLGVEAGQITLVLAVMPFLYFGAKQRIYPRIVKALSLLTVTLASYWLVAILSG